jgi:RimJ/RimL family protein N-acetyltransferase
MDMDVTIREARPEDAEQLAVLWGRLIQEPGAVIRESSGEVTWAAEQEHAFAENERQKMAQYSASGTSLFLVAEVEGRIAGSLNLAGREGPIYGHVAALAVNVDSEWRNQGIGSALVAQAVEWARGTGVIKRIALSVFAQNAAAIHLYEKFGFEIEGRRRRAVFQDGEFCDMLGMALLL